MPQTVLSFLLIAFGIPIASATAALMIEQVVRRRELDERLALASVRIREAQVHFVQAQAQLAEELVHRHRDAHVDALVAILSNQPALPVPERSALIKNVNVGWTMK